MRGTNKFSTKLCQEIVCEEILNLDLNTSIDYLKEVKDSLINFARVSLLIMCLQKVINKDFIHKRLKEKSSLKHKIYLCDDHIECRKCINGYGHFFVMKIIFNKTTIKKEVKLYES